MATCKPPNPPPIIRTLILVMTLFYTQMTWHLRVFTYFWGGEHERIRTSDGRPKWRLLSDITCPPRCTLWPLSERISEQREEIYVSLRKVDMRGLEPLTKSAQGPYSTNWVTYPYSLPYHIFYRSVWKYEHLGGTGGIRTLDQRIKSPLLYHWATVPRYKYYIISVL